MHLQLFTTPEPWQQSLFDCLWPGRFWCSLLATSTETAVVKLCPDSQGNVFNVPSTSPFWGTSVDASIKISPSSRALMNRILLDGITLLLTLTLFLWSAEMHPINSHPCPVTHIRGQTPLTCSGAPDSSKSLTVSGNSDGSCGLCASEGRRYLLMEKVAFQQSAHTTMWQHETPRLRSPVG